jgi:peroxin-14
MIEKNKESQSQSMGELQQELKSLKALLLSRGLSAPSLPTPTLTGRPSIPSWQLASAGQNVTPADLGSSPSASSTSNGKGKEVDRDGV